MVRAKFKCNSVSANSGTQNINGKEVLGKTYSFGAVMAKKDTDGKPLVEDENAIFGLYTPNGSLTMTVYNDDVVFELGKEYYLDFTEASN